jgi:hypothetical protein
MECAQLQKFPNCFIYALLKHSPRRDDLQTARSARSAAAGQTEATHPPLAVIQRSAATKDLSSM